MGLSLEVGILADLRDHDREGAEIYQGYFDTLNEYLASMGLPTHREPDACDVWSADMFGYSGLHALRRLAAYVDSGDGLPPFGDGESSKDPRLDAYFADVEGRRATGVFSRIFGRRPAFSRTFDHLIVHGDAEGFYLPASFDQVLVPPASFRIPGAMVGSAPRLLEELKRLSQLLDIPPTLTSGSDELWEAADSQGEGDERWQRHGIESFSLVVLREGCERSLATGAALVFV